MAISFTSEQELAIRTRDRDLLVSAAAGSGKTATLAERIIRSLTEGETPTSLARIVVVTFTNASADDMRKKIGKELAAALEADPGNRHLTREQLLLPSARISTIDSLCTRLLRRHAEAVGISPSFRIADPAEDTLLAIRVMEEMLDDAFAGEVPTVGVEELCELNDTVTSAKAENDLPKVLRSVYEKHVLYDVRGPLALRDASDAVRAEKEYRQPLRPVVVAEIRLSFKDRQQGVRIRMGVRPHVCRAFRRRSPLFGSQKFLTPVDRSHNFALRERHLVEDIVSPKSMRMQFLCQLFL